jgi:hypothetical protein
MSLRGKVEKVESILATMPEPQKTEALTTLDGIARFAFGSQDVLPDNLKGALTDLMTSVMTSVPLSGPDRTRARLFEAMTTCPTVAGLVRRYV